MLSAVHIDKNVFSRNWRKFLFWGIALVILGILAINVAMFTTLLSVVFLGFILLIAGIAIIIDAVTFWRIRTRGFFLHLLMGFLYLVVGVTLIEHPIQSSISLTLLLGILYLALGAFRTAYVVSHHVPKRLWHLFNALISFILGILILANWPASSLYIIGLFVGIDLFFTGLVYIMGALAGQAMQT